MQPRKFLIRPKSLLVLVFPTFREVEHTAFTITPGIFPKSVVRIYHHRPEMMLVIPVPTPECITTESILPCWAIRPLGMEGIMDSILDGVFICMMRVQEIVMPHVMRR